MSDIEKWAKNENQARVIQGTLIIVYVLGVIVYTSILGSYCGAIFWPFILFGKIASYFG